MSGNEHAVYGRFLAVMKEKAHQENEAEKALAAREHRHPRALTYNGFGPEQIDYVPIIFAMR